MLTPEPLGSGGFRLLGCCGRSVTIPIHISTYAVIWAPRPGVPMPRKRKSYPELEAQRHLLGKVPDHEVAARAGTTPSIVGRYRRSLGIKAYEGYKFAAKAAKAAKAEAAAQSKAVEPAPVEEKVEEVAPAPEAPPAPSQKEDAKKEASGGRSMIAPFHDQVGSIPDKEIAALAGVSTEAVRMYRRRRGIPLEQEKKVAKKKKRSPSRRRSKLDPYHDELGKVPDAEVAAKAGVTPENVRAYRSRHGIAANYRQKRRRKSTAKVAAAAVAAVVVEAPVVEAPVVEAPVVEAPVVEAPVAVEEAPVVAAEEAPAEESASLPQTQAWKFTLADSDSAWVVLADDIAQAAVRASTAVATLSPGGRIGSIAHLGTALV